jgi:pimeloyl-ACP methyl ester carboxylesterase
MEDIMLKRTFIKLLASSILAGTAVSRAEAQAAATSGYKPINGVNYYYEITGKGEPLLVLHGGLGSINMFGLVLPPLVENRQVIAVDLHGHGRTALGDRHISLIDQGADMAILMKSLGYDQVDVMGYSFGGGLAFQFAAQNPAMVRRLVIVSAPYAQDGFYAEMLPQQAQVGAAMAPMMKDTPMYKTYMDVAPKPEDFPRLLDEMGVFMRQPYDWSADVAKLTMPVMLVYGDSDMIRPEHIVKFYQLLGGGLKDAGWMREYMSRNRLAILPDVTHYEMAVAPQLAPTVLPFLNGKSGIQPSSGQVQQ